MIRDYMWDQTIQVVDYKDIEMNKLFIDYYDQTNKQPLILLTIKIFLEINIEKKWYFCVKQEVINYSHKKEHGSNIVKWVLEQCSKVQCYRPFTG